MPKIIVPKDIPQDFICPITQEIMEDPVATVDGHIYDRKSIEAWLKNHDTSPLTNIHLASKNLTTIYLIKEMIQNYKKNKKAVLLLILLQQ